MNYDPKPKRIGEAAEQLFMIAMDHFFEDGRCDIACDACGSPIEFVSLSPEVYVHKCKCGKFNGTLKGL